MPAALRVEAAAEHCGLSETSFRNLSRRDGIKPRAPSQGVRAWLVRDLDAWVQSWPVADGSAPATTLEGWGDTV